jgi:hypothetical protein
VFLENVVDCWHTNQVHAFGRGQMPSALRVERLSDVSMLQYFEIQPSQLSLAYQMGARKLVVENEYHLPNTVLSRVIDSQNRIKTILVRAYPITDKQTVVFWTVYRNYLFFGDPFLDFIHDNVFRFLFEFTIDEDRRLLETVYLDQDRSGQFHTKYDAIQVELRKDLKKFGKDIQLL